MLGNGYRFSLSNSLVGLPLLLSALSLGAQTTIVPRENLTAIQHGWQQDCYDRVQAAQGHPVDILFIGDSITDNFARPPQRGWNQVGIYVWNKHYASRNALDFGVGSDGTEHILWRMDHMPIRDFHPRVVVILAGVNDTGNSPQDIAAGVKAVVVKTESLYPATKIILMNILPNGRAKERTDAANAIIAGLVDNERVFGLDLAPFMPAVGNNWLGLGPDRLHPTEEGYAIWAEHLDPLIDFLTQPAPKTMPVNPEDRLASPIS